MRVLLTFDFEEWEGKYRIYQADLYQKTARLTELLTERNLPATFFLDAETVLKYPDAALLLEEKGFELALHSDYHFGRSNSSSPNLDFSRQDSPTQIARIRKATDMIRQAIPHFDPTGFRSPGLRWNEALYVSLRELDFRYDSSQQDKFALQPLLKEGVTVFPVNCGDYDSAVYKLGAQYVMTVWKDAFRRACHASAQEDVYFMLLAHPSVIGRRNYLSLLKAIIDHMSYVKIQYSTCGQFFKQIAQK